MPMTTEGILTHMLTTHTLKVLKKINLNDATENELLNSIPDLSHSLSHEIIEHRPYLSILEFRQAVAEFADTATAETIEQYAFIPVDHNRSDANTLKQLPGVDDTVAETLINARPYETKEDFLEALAGQVTKADVEAAEHYLAN